MKDIEKYLNEHYQFYFNVFSSKTYYRVKKSSTQFEPLDDYFLNSLYRELRHQQLSVTISDLKTILHSNFVKLRNPFIYFLENITDLDYSTDYILKISSTIKTINDDYFRWA